MFDPMFSACPTPPSAVVSKDLQAIKNNYISALMIEAPPALSNYIIELERKLVRANAELVESQREKKHRDKLTLNVEIATGHELLKLERNLASANAELEVTKNELEKRCQQLKDIESKLSTLFNIP